jgi:hypothetical protein
MNDTPNRITLVNKTPINLRVTHNPVLLIRQFNLHSYHNNTL